MKRLCVWIVCLSLGLLVLNGCSAPKEAYEEKSYTADEGIDAIQIDVKGRKITVEPSQDGRIHVTYYESGKEFYSLDTAGGNTLVMKSESRKEWTDYIGGAAPQAQRTIRLRIPARGISSLRLSTSHQDIYLPALSVSEAVSISVNNGDIQLEQLEAGKEIHLDAKNGSISGTLAGGYDDYSINCSVKKGTCNLPEQKGGGQKALAASVNNGDIDLHFTKETSKA